MTNVLCKNVVRPNSNSIVVYLFVLYVDIKFMNE